MKVKRNKRQIDGVKAMSQLIDELLVFYRDFSADNLAAISDLYAEQAVFMDPVHKVVGQAAITEYFRAIMADVQACRFEFHNVKCADGQALLEWTMHFRHPKLGGDSIAVDGCSVLDFSQKIDRHRDYYDLGEMLYEHVPVLGYAVRYLKHKLASEE